MQSQDVPPRHAPSRTHRAGAAPSRTGPVGEEQAAAALVEHYPRLVRLAYLVLPPDLGRSRRVLTAHALAQRAVPRGRSRSSVLPAQRPGRAGPGAGARRDDDPGYACLREQVLRTALGAARPRTGPFRLAAPPPLLPQVWGLRLFPRSGGADALALDQRLATLSAPARAAYVLRALEQLPDPDVRELLRAAGVSDPGGALASANGVPAHPGLLSSPEFDPCALQARPTDLPRRRRHTKAVLAAAAALAVCGALVALPDGGWGPDGAAAPAGAVNPAATAALDPGRLTRVPPAAWRTSARTDFSVWPARGPLTGDPALLRRALAVWARPGGTVHVSATPGTATGGPAGPPQLLYAGEVDTARVVLLYDGLRVVRYAEPKDGTRGAALDFARVDGATGAGASALVLDRSDGNVRYLGLPGFLVDGVPRAYTHAVFDAPVAGGGGRFPVVLFSPGSGGVRTQNTAWAEELASHGYVVAALDHPYDSAAVVLADGRTIRSRTTSSGDRDEDGRLAARWTAVRAADLRFVLTRLEHPGRDGAAGPLAGRLDTGRVAVTGHSMGGAAALQAARQDRRFDAVIDLDGYPHGPASPALRRPALALTQAITPATDPDYLPRLTSALEHSTATSYRLTVPGAAHLTFMDGPLYLPPVPSVVGSLGRVESPRVVAATTLAFLDATLRHRPVDLAGVLSAHGDLTVHHPDGTR
ncbi:dienelactone hydrolase family protein [Streptomyces sp. NPDC051132]|uniref:alpha/beta hydrolase n=1 Tax=Streptomyces sp. NPDC051132 TaxID=3155667 RepID=UPI0034400FF0